MEKLEESRRLYYGQPLKTLLPATSQQRENHPRNRTSSMIEAFERTLKTLGDGIIVAKEDSSSNEKVVKLLLEQQGPSVVECTEMVKEEEKGKKDCSRPDQQHPSLPDSIVLYQRIERLEFEQSQSDQRLFEAQNKTMQISTDFLKLQVRYKELEEKNQQLMQEQREMQEEQKWKKAAPSEDHVKEEDAVNIVQLQKKIQELELEARERSVAWQKERLEMTEKLQEASVRLQQHSGLTDQDSLQAEHRQRERDLLARIEALIKENGKLRTWQSEHFQADQEHQLENLKLRESRDGLEERYRMLKGQCDRSMEREALLQKELRRIQNASDDRDRELSRLQHQMHQMSIELKQSMLEYLSKNK